MEDPNLMKKSMEPSMKAMLDCFALMLEDKLKLSEERVTTKMEGDLKLSEGRLSTRVEEGLQKVSTRVEKLETSVEEIRKKCEETNRLSNVRISAVEGVVNDMKVDYDQQLSEMENNC